MLLNPMSTIGDNDLLSRVVGDRLRQRYEPATRETAPRRLAELLEQLDLGERSPASNRDRSPASQTAAHAQFELRQEPGEPIGPTQNFPPTPSQRQPRGSQKSS